MWTIDLIKLRSATAFVLAPALFAGIGCQHHHVLDDAQVALSGAGVDGTVIARKKWSRDAEYLAVADKCEVIVVSLQREELYVLEAWGRTHRTDLDCWDKWARLESAGNGGSRVDFSGPFLLVQKSAFTERQIDEFCSRAFSKSVLKSSKWHDAGEHR